MFSQKRVSITSISLLALLFVGSSVASAQNRPPVPRASTKATVMQQIGTTDISVAYSRPLVKGRPIFAEAPESMKARAKGETTLDNGFERKPGEPIVPYGYLWRAGANEATLFTIADDVLVNGQPLAAGKYSLHMIPGKDEWTVIFNKDDGQWGSFAYDAAKDALRVKTKAEPASDLQEALAYMIEPVNDNSAKVLLRWERLRVPFTVEVKDVVGSTMARLRTYVAGAKADDPAPYVNAANYAKQNKLNDDAAKWYEAALKASDEQIKGKANFVNLNRRVQILLAAGRNAEAITAGEKAIEVGKAEKANTAALEKRIADLKAGKN